MKCYRCGSQLPFGWFSIWPPTKFCPQCDAPYPSVREYAAMVGFGILGLALDLLLIIWGHPGLLEFLALPVLAGAIVRFTVETIRLQKRADEKAV